MHFVWWATWRKQSVLIVDRMHVSMVYDETHVPPLLQHHSLKRLLIHETRTNEFNLYPLQTPVPSLPILLNFLFPRCSSKELHSCSCLSWCQLSKVQINSRSIAINPTTSAFNWNNLVLLPPPCQCSRNLIWTKSIPFQSWTM